jgi:hypothetical protein
MCRSSKQPSASAGSQPIQRQHLGADVASGGDLHRESARFERAKERFLVAARREDEETLAPGCEVVPKVLREALDHVGREERPFEHVTRLAPEIWGIEQHPVEPLRADGGEKVPLTYLYAVFDAVKQRVDARRTHGARIDVDGKHALGSPGREHSPDARTRSHVEHRRTGRYERRIGEQGVGEKFPRPKEPRVEDIGEDEEWLAGNALELGGAVTTLVEEPEAKDHEPLPDPARHSATMPQTPVFPRILCLGAVIAHERQKGVA